MYNRSVVFLDLETTGATATHDRITEVGLIEVHEGRFVREWSSLVNPGISIPPAIQALTGISNAMVKDAPRFEDIAREVYEAIDGRVLIAHNARFDYGFLKNEFKRLGSIDCEARHRALGDARVLWQLAQQWRSDPGEAAVLEATAKLLKTATVPAGLPDTVFETIPEGPGVYLFYGDNDVPLYVGKSISLRTRVMAHFSGDHRVNKDMRIAAEVKRVDWIETAGELGALIEEARLVKQLSPVHNRQLRRAGELCSWQWNPDQHPTAPLNISSVMPCSAWKNARGRVLLTRSSAVAAPVPAWKRRASMRCGWPPPSPRCACARGRSRDASASAKPRPTASAASCTCSTSGATSARCAAKRNCTRCRTARRGRCSTSTPTKYSAATCSAAKTGRRSCP